MASNSASNEGSSPNSPKDSNQENVVDRKHSKFAFINKQDYLELSKQYDKNTDGTLDDSEIQQIINDYNDNKLDKSSKIYEIISKYDLNKNGKIDIDEFEKMKHDFSLQESDLRYAAYTLSLSRLFRYLAFTSDFGEALRPVVHKQIVNASYAVAFGYCIADVGYEAYKLKKNNYRNERNEEMTMTQCIVERSTFQAFASLLLPAVVIHQTVHYAKNAFTKLGRFTKWGPSLVGLSLIPFLPVCLDAPVEKAVEYGFHHYGPWAKKHPQVEAGHHSHESKKEK